MVLDVVSIIANFLASLIPMNQGGNNVKKEN